MWNAAQQRWICKHCRPFSRYSTYFFSVILLSTAPPPFYVAGKRAEEDPQPAKPCYGVYHILFTHSSRYRAVSCGSVPGTLSLPQRGNRHCAWYLTCTWTHHITTPPPPASSFIAIVYIPLPHPHIRAPRPTFSDAKQWALLNLWFGPSLSLWLTGYVGTERVFAPISFMYYGAMGLLEPLSTPVLKW
jgi:hypothetical protein